MNTLKEKGFRLVKVPASVHSALKIHCVKTKKAMWYFAGIAINEAIKSDKQSSSNKSK